MVPSLFPGLSVDRIERRADAGAIRRIALGQGELWAVRSPSAGVSYLPTGMLRERHVSVMLQLSGFTDVVQQHRACRLDAGDLCLLDERSAFTINGGDAAEILFMRLPREATLRRHPHLEHHMATTLPAATPGSALVARMLTATLAHGPFLGDAQRQASLLGTLELLGTLDLQPQAHGGGAWWRVQAALAHIELHFGSRDLGAEEVAQAQHISRRRLDQLLSETTGRSITGHIWDRRLAQAAADLRDPQREGVTAAQIAFANGFEDPAHFTRAFKRRYDLSPQQWRVAPAA
jgi:AraC-like DNA-binding protein